ncbi:MAG: hypothetical protein AAFP02_19640 [Bacteroidota bacterium]
MKTQTAPIIIYDDQCPMCQAYTHAFVEVGLLEKENRIGFADAKAEALAHLDLNRARHEIPLLDPQTGEVRYGLKALTYLLSSKLPFLRPLLHNQLVYYSLYPLYQLITYNRRLIANSRSPKEGFDCAPDFHAGYRLAYILLAAMVVILIASKLPLIWIGIGAALSLGTAAWSLGYTEKYRRWDAFAHLATAGLITALLSLALGWTLSVLPPWGTLLYALPFAVGIWSGFRRFTRLFPER